MRLKFYFNQNALEALAKELRRASWGVGAAAATGGIKLGNAWVVLAGGAAWLILQITAVALQSVCEESRERKSK